MDPQLALMPEVQARRLLGDRCLRMHVVRPFGAWVGVGTLRVINVRAAEGGLELLAGYERYDRVEAT